MFVCSPVKVTIETEKVFPLRENRQADAAGTDRTPLGATSATSNDSNRPMSVVQTLAPSMTTSAATSSTSRAAANTVTMGQLPCGSVGQP